MKGDREQRENIERKRGTEIESRKKGEVSRHQRKEYDTIRKRSRTEENNRMIRREMLRGGRRKER